MREKYARNTKEHERNAKEYKGIRKECHGIRKQYKEIREENKGNASDAAKVGGLIAQKAVELGLKKVAFDRSGYKFHGRVEALAQAAREGGLDF